MLWALVYDTMYAMVDKKDDLKIGVKSTAILFGEKDREIIGMLQFIVLVLLTVVGQMQQLGWAYYGGLIGAAGLSLYQQTLIFHRERDNCFKAFLNSNWFGMTVFAGLAFDYLLT